MRRRLSMALLAFAPILVPVGARADFIPNDPYFQPYQWALQKMNLPTAWGYSLGSPDVTIALLDTGLITATPQLQGHFLPPLNVFNSPEPSASLPHGTWVASTIGMTINDGIAGAGTGNFTILPIRVTDGAGHTSDDEIIAGINLAAENNARIISISLSALSYGYINNAITQALAQNQLAGRKDFLVFMSAGNSNREHKIDSDDLDNAQNRPANDNIIMVSGTDQSDARWVDPVTGEGSDYGPFVDLAAPAANIVVANGVDASMPYGYAQGTSFSSPLAASAAALAFSINPDLTAAQVEDLLFRTAFNPDSTTPGTPFWDEVYGWGRVDFGALAQGAEATLSMPEPGSLSLAVMGGGALLIRRRRSR